MKRSDREFFKSSELLPDTLRPIDPRNRIKRLRALHARLGKAVEYETYLQSLLPTKAVKRLRSLNRSKLIRIAEEIYSCAKRPNQKG